MANKKQQKMPWLPLRIRMRANGSFYDTYTGKTVSLSELERYKPTELKTDHKQDINKQEQWWQYYDNM